MQKTNGSSSTGVRSPVFTCVFKAGYAAFAPAVSVETKQTREPKKDRQKLSHPHITLAPVKKSSAAFAPASMSGTSVFTCNNLTNGLLLSAGRPMAPSATPRRSSEASGGIPCRLRHAPPAVEGRGAMPSPASPRNRQPRKATAGPLCGSTPAATPRGAGRHSLRPRRR